MNMTLLSPEDSMHMTDDLHIDRLNHIDPDLAAMRRVVFCGRGLVHFNSGDTPFRMQFVAEEANFFPKLALQFGIGTERGWLLLESFDLFGAEWAGVFSMVDGVLIHALLADELSHQVEQLSRASGEMVQLLDFQLNYVLPKDAASQMLRIDNVRTNVGVRAKLVPASNGFFDHVARVMASRRPQSRGIPAMACLPIRLSLGVTCLAASKYSQIRTGGVLILPTLGAPSKVEAGCLDSRNKRLPIRARVDGKNVRLTSHEGGMIVTDFNVKVPAHPEPATLEEASVPVTAVIGEFELPIRLVGALHAGYVFELPTELQNVTISLYTGSRCVGTGKLVSVGERLGVRLLEWGGANNGGHA